MKIQIRNQANLSNKHIRFIKWKIYRTKRKFPNLLAATIFISKEGSFLSVYKAVIKLALAGKDIVITHSARDPKDLWRQTFNDVQRYVRKYKEKNQNSIIKQRHWQNKLLNFA